MFLRSSGSYKLKVIAIILVLTTLACSVSGKNAATAVPSASAGPQTETPASVPATSTPLPPTLTPTNTEAPTEVPTSTPTLTPTAVPTREVGIGKKDILIHTGPDNKYPVTGSLTANQTVDVTARNSDGTWFELLPLEGRSGWIAGAGLAAGEADKAAGLPIQVASAPPPPVIKGWSGNPVENICYQSQVSFSGRYLKDNPNTSPNDSPDVLIAQILLPSGVSFSSVGDPNCNATLAVDVKINQLGAQYISESDQHEEYCYSGVSVTATFTLTQDKKKLVVSSTKDRGNEYRITGCAAGSDYSDESDWVIVDGLHKMWGNAVLKAELGLLSSNLVGYAVNAAGALGRNGMGYVPDLINIMGNDSQNLDAAHSALKKIAGKDVGNDSYAWGDWWSGISPTYQPTVDALQPFSAGNTSVPSGDDTATPEAAAQATAGPSTQASSGELIHGSITGPAAGPDVEVESLNGYQTADGFLTVGLIKNNKSTPIEFGRANIVLQGASGAQVDTEDAYTDEEIIMPGASGSFLWIFYGRSGVKSLTANDVHYMDADLLQPQITVDSSSWTKTDEVATINGQVKNNSTVTIPSVRVTARYFDSQNNLVGSMSATFDTQLLPGQVAPFYLAQRQYVPFDHYTVTAEYHQF